MNRQDAKKSVGPGWTPLIDSLFDLMPEGVDVVQVKEKFGTLRFYYDGPNDFDNAAKFDGMVRLAEHASQYICEKCGRHGRNEDRHGWMMTLCGECAAELDKSREQ